MAFLDFLLTKGEHALAKAFAPATTFGAPSLAFSLLLAAAFLYWRHRRRRGRASLALVFRALAAKRVFLSRSTMADLGYLLFNTTALGLVIGWGLCSGALVERFVGRSLDGALGVNAATAPNFWPCAFVTLALYLTYEFAFWFDHYLKHNVPFLWETHKTHHMAEVLTPITQFRVHPLDSLVFANVLALCEGSVGGLLDHAFGGTVPVFAVDGKNVALVVFVFTTQHLQHSEIWIPFRGWLGRLFISPAHHQLHHSTDPAHFNANLGASLAVFDWLFGTLSVPGDRPAKLSFGVEGEGVDPQALHTLAVRPFVRTFAALREALWPERPEAADRASPASVRSGN